MWRWLVRVNAGPEPAVVNLGNLSRACDLVPPAGCNDITGCPPELNLGQTSEPCAVGCPCEQRPSTRPLLGWRAPVGQRREGKGILWSGNSSPLRRHGSYRSNSGVGVKARGRVCVVG